MEHETRLIRLPFGPNHSQNPYLYPDRNGMNMDVRNWLKNNIQGFWVDWRDDDTENMFFEFKNISDAERFKEKFKGRYYEGGDPDRWDNIFDRI